ncbi:DUF1853 family protein [Polaribacter ponticola]|uniref:DUF1853 family protein n=1 Tax=Polaribacter ponticola TaxID=2978475 RepID=A0ABT5S7C1_9FLAO|nr:DUF1853 family protein [Polaribacter sp. MSW5]MDD7913992.1 DUF1853 family protein [Polaribacter sp. MSW5]
MEKNAVYNLNQLDIEVQHTKFNLEINDNLRLGKYIERFVSFELKQNSSIEIISENIQIQKEKITLGELDCIILKDKEPIHLEVIYKFYLYDVNVGETNIEHFIGPNRKDSLIQKLKKLKEKQLPLLYSNECKDYLESIYLSVEKITQQVYFKAQLFVPLFLERIQLTKLNTNCIAGFYINKKELEQFKDCKFYIPNKKDWLIIPHQNITWLNYDQFKIDSNHYLVRNFSPMCWFKLPNGEIKKFF